MSHFVKQIIFVFIASIGVFGFYSSAMATGKVWQVIENPHFSSSTMATVPLAFDSNDLPYFAYQDSSSGNKATVMKYTGSEWLTVGNAGFSSDTASGLALALDSEDTPYVVFANVASSSRALVMKYNEANWVTVGNADFSGPSITDTKIVFSPAGTPYVTFADVDHHITIMKLNVATWETVGDPYTDVQGASPVLDFSSAGVPYVAFSDIGTGQPTIIKFDGVEWNLVGTPIAGINLASNLSFAVSPHDTLFVGTVDINDYLLRTFTFNGDEWVQIGTTGTIVTGGDTVMKFSPNGTLYIAYGNEGNTAIVMKYGGTDWEIVGESGFSTKAITMMSLAFDSSATPYIAYSDFAHNHVVVMGLFPTFPGQVASLSLSVQSPSAVALSWTAPTDNGGSAITGYKIERESPLGTGFSLVTTIASSMTTYSDSGLVPGTAYRYKVSAMNAVGTGSGSLQDVTTSHPSSPGVVLIAPTSFTPPGATASVPLSFTIQSGTRTSNPTITAVLNANPQTVRGYVISLDPTFAHDGIFPYTADTHTVVFTLPNISGTYTVYFKYYSTSGIYSPLFSQTITYQGGPTPGSSPPAVSSQAFPFKRTLQIGSQGADVKALQIFLNAHGFPVARTGVGSIGHETSLYGKQTAAAVAKFQEAYAREILIPLRLRQGTGMFGTATLKFINEKSSLQ